MISYDLKDIEIQTIPWSVQDVLNDEYGNVMDQVNSGDFSYISKKFNKELKDLFLSGELEKKFNESVNIQNQIKQLIIQQVSKLSSHYDIHWDYEAQELNSKHKKIISKVSKHIKQVTRHKNFKVNSVYIYGEVGVYIAKSVFNKIQIGIDMDRLIELMEEMGETDLESELYVTILHELKHADQDLENRLKVNDKDLEDEAEEYGRIVAQMIKNGETNITL